MNYRPYITVEELNRLFYQPPKKKSFTWKQLPVYLLIVLTIFLVLNGPAVYQQLQYWWSNDIGAAQEIIPVVRTTPVSLPPASQPTNVEELTNQNFSRAQVTELPNNTLWVPKLKLKAPIIWDVTAGSDVNTDLLKALENGVVRYPQTALPDQAGNVFLTGHSSNYWWEKGRYKTVFALLDKLIVGDLVHVAYENQIYTYRVKGQKIIKPTETSVLDSTGQPVLSLMTCTPTGTALLRRIVFAELVSPLDNLRPHIVKPAPDTLHAIR